MAHKTSIGGQALIEGIMMKGPHQLAIAVRQPDGQINLTPNDTAYKAVRDAMNGWDPTYGCLYYYNPRTATNKWIRSLPISTTIGSHVFCRAK